MRQLRFFRLELGRLFHNRLALLAFGLTVLSPLAGLFWYRPLFSTSSAEYVTTMNGMYIANPALAGGLLGAILFAVLAVWQWDMPNRYRTGAITDTIRSPLGQAAVRLSALLAAAVLVQAAVTLLWLPYTMARVGDVFTMSTYLLSYWVLMFPTLPVAVLFVTAAYQFTRRVDISLIAFVAFAACSLVVFQKNWQLCWLNPILFAVSDDFTNRRLFRTVGYARLTWLLGLSGLWAVSWLCVRQYGRGPLGSLLRSARRAYRPAVAAVLLAAAGLAYVGQPMYDRSSPDLTQTVFTDTYCDDLTCSERYADVRPDAKTGELYGRAVYQLQNTSGQPKTMELIINPGYTLSSVRTNGADAVWSLTDIEASNGRVVTVELPADERIELEMCYGGYPRAWNFTSSFEPGDPEISDTYMCLENWLIAPCVRNVVSRGGSLPATIDLTLPEQMTPVLFGPGEAELLKEEGGMRVWRMRDTGYNSIIYAGDYVSERVEAAGLKVDFYYGRKHREIMEKADVAGAVRQVITYCTEHYGPLTSYADGKFKLLQSRASGGGYAGDGASTMDELDFTARNLTDQNKGTGAGEVLIHELVHQWWGLDNMFDVSDQTGAWSSEGLTVYTTYRIMKERYGGEYVQKNYVEAWQREVDDYYRNFYVRHPEYLSALPEQFRLDISNSLAGVRHYSEMPLKLLKAEQLVGGEEAMDKILRTLFNRELDWSYPYLTYQEFLDACGLTEEDLSLD